VALGESLLKGDMTLGVLQRALSEFVSAALTEAAGAQEAEEMCKQVYAALSYQCMWRYATSVCGLTLPVYVSTRP